MKLLIATDNGGGVVWYPDNISTVPLNPEDLLIDGQVYYAGVPDGSCAGNRIAVTAELEDYPVAGSRTNLNFDSNNSPVDIVTLLNSTPVGPAQYGGYMVPGLKTGGTIFDPSLEANWTGTKRYKHYVPSNNNYCSDDETFVYINISPAPNTSHRLYYLGINEADAEKYLEYYPPSSPDEGLEVNIWLDVPLQIGTVQKITVNGQERFYYVNNVYATPDTTPDLTLTSDTPIVKQSWGLPSGGQEGEVSGLAFPEYGPYQGPSFSNENYVYTRMPQVAVSNMDSITTTNEVVEQISYFDGLGRPMQSVAIRAGGDQEDLVTPVDYDEYGRQTKQYLPFAAQSLGGQIFPSALNQVQDFYNTPEFKNTPNPFSESELEASPLNRVLKQAAPGADWALGSGHEIEFDYSTNDSLEVRLFEVVFTGGDFEDPSLALATEEYYQPGTLYKSITRDENHSGTTKNHTTEEFKDKQGRVVLKRTYADTPQQAQDPHDTYYVYDAYGNLTYVLPPKMEGSTATLNSILADLPELGYQYIYDGRNRLVQKQLPGKGEDYVIYNGLDQPVLTQDANLRLEYKWHYTKYDAHGRVTSTGIYTDSQTLGRENMQVQVDNFYSGTTPPKMYEQKAGSVYTNQAFPVSGTEVLTENFYDDYNFNKGTITLPVASLYGKNLTAATKGLVTGSRVKVLGEPHWKVSVSGYDDKGRAIWSASENPFLGTKDVVHSQLDFMGKVLQQTEAHTRDTLEIRIENFYTYDHVGRQLMHTQKINGGEEELIAHHTYDALGQLVQKRVGGKIEADLTTTPVPTTFTDLVGVTVGTDGSITKSISTDTWGDSGLATENSFSGDGYVEYVVPQTDKNFMVGISTTNTNAHYNTINYAIQTRDDQKFYIFQNGVNASGSNGIGTYMAGDTFRIERIGTTVYFKKNAIIVFAISTMVTGDMIGDVSMRTPGGIINGLNLVQKISGVFQPLQTMDYAYNIRGWLKKINDPTQLGEDLFGFEISYNDPRSGATPLYNGNISETHWNTQSENNTLNPISNQYLYSYDALNRIKSAIDNTGNYNLENVSYDKMGNILSLQRQGLLDANATLFGNIDHLLYTYDFGNKLMRVSDSGNDLEGFKDDEQRIGVVDSSDDYGYDPNGNLTFDANKGIPTNGITYNHLNLPNSITLPGGTITYTYDGDGNKLRKLGDGATTDYAGNFVYKNGVLEFFGTPEGYVSYDNGQSKYVYNYVDHLGNVRLNYSDTNVDGQISPEDNEILDEKNYYPFGLEHDGYNNVVNGVKNNYHTFNGVEHEESLGLNLYEMDWRSFDPAIGRWTSIDPVTHFNLSPYNGMDNNPIIGSDPSGSDVIEIEGGYRFTGQEAIDVFKILQGNTGNSSNYETENEISATESKDTETTETPTGNSTRNTISAISSTSSQDPCPKCPDKEKRKLAIMMAKHQGGNAQDYYDALVNPDFVGDRIESNVFWLSSIFTLTSGVPLLNTFSKRATAITFGKNANQIFHTFRHIEAAGLSKEAVKRAVQKSIKQSSSLIKTGKSFNKTITVRGKKIRYSAYKLPSGEINVGRIVIPK